jgi:hypothetical protein
MATRKAICLVSGLFEEVNTPTDKLDFAGNSTSDLTEGTNEYFTNARARGAISVTDSGGDGSLSYNSTSGVITYTGPSASEVRAHLSVATGSGLTYNSTSGEFGTSAIPNSQLANDDITIGTTAIALGASSTTLGGLTSVTSTNLIGSTSVLIGTADAANSILLNSTGIVFEGSTANDFETTLNVVDPTADRALNLPDNSGTLLSTGSSIANANLANSTITVGTTSIALGASSTTLDGLTSVISTAVTIGATDAANSILLNSSGITFEGSGADAHETTLSVINPDADRAINLPNLSGTVALLESLSVATGSGLTYNNSTGEFGTSAIPNAQLANSSITVGSTGIALGGTATTIAGLTSITSAAVVTNGGVSGIAIRDATDATKIARFSSASITTSTTRTYTFPDANGTFALLGTANAFTGANTFTNTTGQTFRQAATQDGFIIQGRGGGTSDFAVTMTTATLTANRTITFPDLAGNVLLDTSTLPSTFSDANFRVQDNGDATKQLAFECSGITTSTTRTLTVPDENGTIATQDFTTALAIALG